MMVDCDAGVSIIHNSIKIKSESVMMNHQSFGQPLILNVMKFYMERTSKNYDSRNLKKRVRHMQDGHPGSLK